MSELLTGATINIQTVSVLAETPLLEVLNRRNSHSLIKQVISSPPRYSTPAVHWSNLRTLTLSPDEEEGMACLRPILDAAFNTLEELYLTSIDTSEGECKV